MPKTFYPFLIWCCLLDTDSFGESNHPWITNPVSLSHTTINYELFGLVLFLPLSPRFDINRLLGSPWRKQVTCDMAISITFPCLSLRDTKNIFIKTNRNQTITTNHWAVGLPTTCLFASFKSFFLHFCGLSPLFYYSNVNLIQNEFIRKDMDKGVTCV